MEQTPHREERPVRSGRLTSALRSSAKGCVAAVACALWIGLALPGLQLLPGVGDLANTSIAISLQSALLGIDDSSGGCYVRLGAGRCTRARLEADAQPAALARSVRKWIARHATQPACPRFRAVNRSAVTAGRRRARTSAHDSARRLPAATAAATAHSSSCASEARCSSHGARSAHSVSVSVSASGSDAQPADDRLHVGPADKCRCGRGDVRGFGCRQLRTSRHAVSRPLECGHLHGHRHNRRLHRDWNLHDRRRPGRQQQLSPRYPGSAVVRGRRRHAVAQRADGQLRLRRPGRRGRGRLTVCRCGDRELRPARRHLGDVRQRGCLQPRRLDRPL